MLKVKLSYTLKHQKQNCKNSNIYFGQVVIETTDRLILKGSVEDNFPKLWMDSVKMVKEFSLS